MAYFLMSYRWLLSHEGRVKAGKVSVGYQGFFGQYIYISVPLKLGKIILICNSPCIKWFQFFIFLVFK